MDITTCSATERPHWILKLPEPGFPFTICLSQYSEQDRDHVPFYSCVQVDMVFRDNVSQRRRAEEGGGGDEVKDDERKEQDKQAG